MQRKTLLAALIATLRERHARLMLIQSPSSPAGLLRAGHPQNGSHQRCPWQHTEYQTATGTAINQNSEKLASVIARTDRRHVSR